MQSTPSLPSLPRPLCRGEVAPDKALSMARIELNCNYAKLNCLKSNYSFFFFNAKQNCLK